MTAQAKPCFVKDCQEPTDGLVVNDMPTCIGHLDDALALILQPLHDALDAHVDG